MSKRYFVFLYSRGPNWVDDKSGYEQPFISGHFELMDKLKKQDVLVIGGPFTDESGVMGVLMAGSLEEAKRLVNDDPVISNEVMTAQVKAWQPAVTGSIE